MAKGNAAHILKKKIILGDTETFKLVVFLPSFSSVTVVSQALLEDGQCWRSTGRNQRPKQNRGQDKSILSLMPTGKDICGSTLM